MAEAGTDTSSLEPDPSVAKVAELMRDMRTAMLTTVDAGGRLVARPMAVQEVEDNGNLWFVTDGDTPKVRQIATDAQVGVAFASSDAWVSLTGRAEIVHDLARTQELWNTVLDAWFPDGPTTAGLALLTIHAESAEYWDGPGGRIATVLSFVKAKVTGERYDGGENEVVPLGD